MSRTLRARAFAVALGAMAAHAVTAAAAPDLAGLLSKSGAYVLDFERQLSGIVAEEVYRQRTLPDLVEAELKSDLLMIKPADGDRYVAFRDVFAVNGRPVRDREDRLFKLFLSPNASTGSQAQTIAAESARHNIGGVERTINVPTFALAMLDPRNQSRFSFTITNNRRAELIDSMPRESVVVRFEERQHPTMIQSRAGLDAPTSGRFWLEPESGRVLASEMTTEVPSQPAGTRVLTLIDVAYRTESGIGPLVPHEMRERYEIRRGSRQLELDTGVATYSHFRQFAVTVNEKFGPK